MPSELIDYYDLVSSAFRSKFIHFDEIASALCTGYVEVTPGQNDGMNVLLFGEGGYGKSTMALDFARTVLKGQTERGIFIQSVGASTREDEIWGGIDLLSLREGTDIRYHLEQSFLSYHIVIFEEFFDLPGRILFDFKDTLSAREFRRGAQNQKMDCRFIIACTNRDPAEISKLSTSHEALVQRFPLVVKAEWPSHRANDYLEMLQKQLPEHKSLAPLFANICANVVGKGVKPIPPRIARDALNAVVSRARSRGRQIIVPEDLSALKSVHRFRDIWTETKKVIEGALNTLGGTLELNRINVEATVLIARLKELAHRDVQSYATITADLDNLRSQANFVSIPGEKGEGFVLKQAVLKSITEALSRSKQERRS